MNKKLIISLLVIVLFIGLVWFLQNRAPQNKADSTAIVSSRTSETGNYLTDMEGRTLYYSTEDKPLESKCVDKCAEQWPIFEYNNKDLTLATDPLSKRLNIIKRADGLWQYSYDVKPLYYYASDKKPGDKFGDGVGGARHLILLP